MIKSRYLMICLGIIFIALNVYELLNTLGDDNNGIVLLKYNIQGKYTIMKRSMKRSIYLQVLLFSVKDLLLLWTRQ